MQYILFITSIHKQGFIFVFSALQAHWSECVFFLISQQENNHLPSHSLQKIIMAVINNSLTCFSLSEYFWLTILVNRIIILSCFNLVIKLIYILSKFWDELSLLSFYQCGILQANNSNYTKVTLIHKEQNLWHYSKQVRHLVALVQGEPKKNRTHTILTGIHKFNSRLFFFSGYEVDSVHEKLGPYYSPTCPEVRVYKVRIISIYFCRSNKKVYGFCFFFGHPARLISN